MLDFLEVKEVAAAHVRAVAGAGMVDKEAAAPAELGSWFNSKVAYRVDVDDLGGHGFPLIGARLDYLLDKPVATLVYGRENHPISLFVFPAKAGDPMAVRGTKHGYNVVGWSDGVFAYFAASDLARSELDRLEEVIGKGQKRQQSFTDLAGRKLPMSELFRREAVQHATRRLVGRSRAWPHRSRSRRWASFSRQCSSVPFCSPHSQATPARQPSPVCWFRTRA